MHTSKGTLRRAFSLVLFAALLSACSHDRYLFIERADLNQLNQQLHQQQSRLETLAAVNQQQLDTLNQTQRYQHQEMSAALKEQSRTLAQLQYTRPPARPANPSPTTSQTSGRYQGKLVVGEVEKFFLATPGLIFDARIDSGATTSSLHATNIQPFERDGEDWVRFEIAHPEAEEPIVLERPLSRRARIIQANSEEAERRPVVELPFVIGDHRQSAEFTLNDRGHLTYPVLIGRNVLRDVMLIDVGREHVTQLPEGLKTPDSQEDSQ